MWCVAAPLSHSAPGHRRTLAIQSDSPSKRRIDGQQLLREPWPGVAFPQFCKKENAKNELPAEAPIEIVTMVSKLQQSSTEDDTPLKKSTRPDLKLSDGWQRIGRRHYRSERQ